MADQAKFQKMLEVLLMLDCQYGRSISELSERFKVSQRTIYRYFDTFKHVGFVLENRDGYFKINKNETTARDISDLLHFSDEESFILSKAIHSINSENKQKDKLVKKLYSLYDYDRVIHAITRKAETENIYTLIQAIKKQKQVVLKNYKSNNSNLIKDRLVEPIDFTENYIGIWCYDPFDGKNKIFKTSRMELVELLDISWQHKSKHQKGETDIFRMHGFKSIPIELELTLTAYNFLIEEYPLSELYLTKTEKNSFNLITNVCSFLGVGRFVLGLPGEVKIIAPQELKDYLKEKNKLKNV
jgi:proteasome accessory factor C